MNFFFSIKITTSKGKKNRTSCLQAHIHTYHTAWDLMVISSWWPDMETWQKTSRVSWLVSDSNGVSKITDTAATDISPWTIYWCLRRSYFWVFRRVRLPSAAQGGHQTQRAATQGNQRIPVPGRQPRLLAARFRWPVARLSHEVHAMDIRG